MCLAQLLLQLEHLLFLFEIFFFPLTKSRLRFRLVRLIATQ
jgi:hypothetical protein